MSVSTMPPGTPPRSKKGLGCLGCGCLVLVLLLVLFLGLVGGTTYLIYSKVYDLTSATPSDVRALQDDDNIFATAQQKIAAFTHDVKNHQATTLHLSADEINALIAHTPGLTQKHFHCFVSIMNGRARAKMSFPSDAVTYGTIKSRYFNPDATFDVSFDSSTKSIQFEPEIIKIDNRVAFDKSNMPASNQNFNESMFSIFNQALNNNLRQNAETGAFLDQVKSMELKDGEIVIETE